MTRKRKERHPRSRSRSRSRSSREGTQKYPDQSIPSIPNTIHVRWLRRYGIVYGLVLINLPGTLGGCPLTVCGCCALAAGRNSGLWHMQEGNEGGTFLHAYIALLTRELHRFHNYLRLILSERNGGFAGQSTQSGSMTFWALPPPQLPADPVKDTKSKTEEGTVTVSFAVCADGLPPVQSNLNAFLKQPRSPRLLAFSVVHLITMHYAAGT